MLDVGEEVRVFDVNGKRHGMPEGGWPGEVVKVGRVLATIRCRNGEQTFRLDTGQANDRYGHQWFLTVDQATEKTRRHRAESILREYGVETSRASLSTGQLEAIAEIVKNGLGGPR
jgi:hypothetical protein